VPGFKPEESRHEVEAETLTISGKHDKGRDGKHYLRHDRRYGSFSRSIALPEGGDAFP
jgi:HSP20 family protein